MKKMLTEQELCKKLSKLFGRESWNPFSENDLWKILTNGYNTNLFPKLGNSNTEFSIDYYDKKFNATLPLYIIEICDFIREDENDEDSDGEFVVKGYFVEGFYERKEREKKERRKAREKEEKRLRRLKEKNAGK